MSNNKKVVKLNKSIRINAATCVVAAILLYVIICIIRMAAKEPISIYRVSKSNVNNNITLNAIAVRDEQLLKTPQAGYVCYYIRDGEKIKKNSTICTIDETGELFNVISESENYDNLLTSDDYNDIRALISLYKVTYNDDTFYNAYNFENNVNNKVVELTNEIMMQQVSGTATSMSAVNSPYSGIVTYYIDGYENFDIQSISAEAFDMSKYQKQTLKTGDVVSANNPIIKVVPNENWNIIAPITPEQYSSISDSSYIYFRINNSSYTVSMPYEIINGTDGTYINIKINKYLSNYISERFLSIEILQADDTGLKVPVSALVEKDTYKIPIDYLSAGGNQTNTNRINVQVRNENGDITINQIKPNIYMIDEEYCYVDPNSFNDTDVLMNINTNQTIAVSLLEIHKLSGVYSANRGTAEFRHVTVLKTIDDFALIKSGEDISVYDNIIFDSSKVKENQVIY